MSKSAQKRGSNLYFSAKISERQFLDVLWQFVSDATLSEAARSTGTSITSVQAIFHKIRVYFCDLHVFETFEFAPSEVETPDPELIAYVDAVWSYYDVRMRRKRRSPPLASMQAYYHLAESFWRFDYLWLRDFRTIEQVQRLMCGHLLEIVRACGPIGGKKPNIPQSRIIRRQQAARMLGWRKLYKFGDIAETQTLIDYELNLERTLRSRARASRRKNVRFR